MQKNIEKKIIELYKKGFGCVTITKKLKIPKHHILKILNSEKLIRTRDRCESLEYHKKDDNFIVNRVCPKCNTLIETKSKNKKIACRNHYTKIKKNSLCKRCSLHLQIGRGNPFYGKKHTNKTKQKISKSRKGKATGINNSMSNPEFKAKASKNLKKSWESGKLENTRKKMSEHMKKTLRFGKIKSKVSSKKEKEIYELLIKYGYKVKRFFKIDTKICDLYIPSLNLIIEYFGDYWHCNPKKYSSEYINQKKQMTAKEIWDYDKHKVDLIVSYGYNLEVIWESDFKTNTNKILTIINKYDKSINTTPERS